MWIRARSAVARWLAPEVSPPPLSPAEVAQQARDRDANREQARLAREQAERLAWQQDAARREAEAWAIRRQASREAIEQACTGPLRSYFPGDPLPGPRDRFGAPRLRSWRQWLGEVVDAMGGGRS